MLKNACVFCKIVGAVAILGALNWGLVGLADYNVVAHLFGAASVVTRVIYGLIGLSGLALLASYFMDCPFCKKDLS